MRTRTASLKFAESIRDNFLSANCHAVRLLLTHPRMLVKKLSLATLSLLSTVCTSVMASLDKQMIVKGGILTLAVWVDVATRSGRR